jgi:hypothetical protein
MQLTTDSTIVGDCHGWSGETRFELDNGQTWEQAPYRYFYRYRPRARTWQIGVQYFRQIDDGTEMLPVRQVR